MLSREWVWSQGTSNCIWNAKWLQYCKEQTITLCQQGLKGEETCKLTPLTENQHQPSLRLIQLFSLYSMMSKGRAHSASMSSASLHISVCLREWCLQIWPPSALLSAESSRAATGTDECHDFPWSFHCSTFEWTFNFSVSRVYVLRTPTCRD